MTTVSTSLLHLLQAPATAGVSACVLGLALIASGLSKGRDLDGASEAIVSFGFGSRPRRELAIVLASGEAILGSAIVVGVPISDVLMRSAVIASGILFVFFGAIITRSLLSGERFPCH